MSQCRRTYLSFVLALVLASSAAADAIKPSRTDQLGDPLPPGAVARIGSLRLYQEGRVGRLAFAADGKTLASWHGGEGGTLCVWDAANGKEVRRVRLPAGRLFDLALLPGGRSVAVLGGGGREVFLWDFASGKEPPPKLKPPDKPFPDIRLGGDNEHFSYFVLSPNGKTLAGGSFGFTNRKRRVQLWTVQTGKELRQLPPPRKLERNQGVIRWLAFSSDSKILVSACPAEDAPLEVLTLWDVESGKELRRVRVPLAYFSDPGVSAAVGPGGRLVALGREDGTIRLWDTFQGKELHRLIGTTSKSRLGRTIASVALSPDGKQLASAGWDGTVRLWDTTSGKQLHLWRISVTGVEAVAFSPDGRTLAAGGGEGVVRRLEPSQVLGPPGQYDRPITSLALSPDGATLATSGGDGVALWEATTGKLQRQIPDETGWTVILGFPAGGRQLRCASESKTLRIWDALSGKELRVFKSKSGNEIGIVTVSPDARYVIPRATHELVSRWDVDTGTETRLAWLMFGGQPSAAVSADGKVVAACGMSTISGIILWNLTAATPRQVILWDFAATSPRQVILGLALSDDGKLLASTSHPATQNSNNPELSGPLLVWNVRTAKLVRRFPVPADQKDDRHITCVAFTPDGRMLLTGQTDGTVAAYEMATGQLRRKYSGHQAGVTALSFSASGRLLATASRDHTALVWDLTGLAELGKRKLTPAELDHLWTGLADTDAGQAYRAMQALTSAPEQALPFLKGKLHLAGPPLPPGRLAKLLKDLDSNRFAIRTRATTELEKLGELAEEAILKARDDNPSLEKKRRLERLLAKLDRPWEHVLPPAELRQLRAVEAVELIGGPEARRILATLAAGSPDAWLTREAQASLERLKRRPQY
jgi:WD40 repeat protein